MLRVVAATGLAVDAYVHADLAPAYAGPGGVVGQQGLFLVEAGIAVAAALLVLTRGRPAATTFSGYQTGSYRSGNGPIGPTST